MNIIISKGEYSKGHIRTRVLIRHFSVAKIPITKHTVVYIIIQTINKVNITAVCSIGHTFILFMWFDIIHVYGWRICVYRSEFYSWNCYCYSYREVGQCLNWIILALARCWTIQLQGKTGEWKCVYHYTHRE